MEVNAFNPTEEELAGLFTEFSYNSSAVPAIKDYQQEVTCEQTPIQPPLTTEFLEDNYYNPDFGFVPPTKGSTVVTVSPEWIQSIISPVATPMFTPMFSPIQSPFHQPMQTTPHPLSQSILPGDGMNQADFLSNWLGISNNDYTTIPINEFLSSKGLDSFPPQGAVEPKVESLLELLGYNAESPPENLNEANDSSSTIVSSPTSPNQFLLKTLQVENKTLFQCPHPNCTKTFTRPYNLKSHYRNHTGERPYRCEFPGCDLAFARKYDQKRHSKLHSGVKQFVCEHCGKGFIRTDYLKRHLQEPKSGRESECAQYRRAREENKIC